MLKSPNLDHLYKTFLISISLSEAFNSSVGKFHRDVFCCGSDAINCLAFCGPFNLQPHVGLFREIFFSYFFNSFLPLCFLCLFFLELLLFGLMVWFCEKFLPLFSDVSNSFIFLYFLDDFFAFTF